MPNIKIFEKELEDGTEISVEIDNGFTSLRIFRPGAMCHDSFLTFAPEDAEDLGDALLHALEHFDESMDPVEAESHLKLVPTPDDKPN